MARRKKQPLEGGLGEKKVSDQVEVEKSNPNKEEGEKPINLNRTAIIAGTLLSYNLRLGSPRILTDLYRFYQEHGCVLDEENVEKARSALKSVLTSTDKQESVDKEMNRITAFLNLMLGK